MRHFQGFKLGQWNLLLLIGGWKFRGYSKDAFSEAGNNPDLNI